MGFSSACILLAFDSQNCCCLWRLSHGTIRRVSPHWKLLMTVTGWQSLRLSAPRLMPIDSQATRLNLVIPTVMDKWSYGGIPTALRFFDRLAKEFDASRMIIT